LVSLPKSVLTRYVGSLKRPTLEELKKAIAISLELDGG